MSPGRDVGDSVQRRGYLSLDVCPFRMVMPSRTACPMPVPLSRSSSDHRSVLSYAWKECRMALYRKASGGQGSLPA